jgi:hypothetical protein
MMETKKSFSEILSRIISLTKQGDIIWSKDTRSRELLTSQGKVNIDIVYMTNYKGRLLRLYKEKKSVDELSRAAGALIRITGITHSIDYFTIELIDSERNIEWNFPNVPETKELYEVVKYQVADITGFIDTLFEENK